LQRRQRHIANTPDQAHIGAVEQRHQQRG
jgi:hypothetical protein